MYKSIEKKSYYDNKLPLHRFGYLNLTFSYLNLRNHL